MKINASPQDLLLIKETNLSMSDVLVPWESSSFMETVLLLFWKLLNNSLNRLCFRPLSAEIMLLANVPLLLQRC